ncbi:MAG: sulfite exporter TauE/SafE family protein [Nitrospinaceae bacterium]|jgi:uncharacterized protein|nr:sulfite exporter TauE/SafE family protein [Nitrospinaceae bacterium]MBT3433252.1 sulfite exporter TauE/SafE family protein [Nitrospinaceae bacterium]MBT3820801.1 sulfite exporter TauE/SafE family protein [Nitrospinaceae bacterium]MBT4431274.1 sulfite exporter TauE/SafE family protein [Nitrospinaceae bacterium]MBT5366594.1 sulfite exporter TauE/SafE family protein [Nitrospinaceae bacterium]
MNLLLVFVAAFIGSGLKAIGGFGFATLATPAIALFWDVPTAIAVVSIPTMLTSVLNGWRAREAIEEGLSPFLPFVLASLAGLGLGLTLLFSTDARFMKLFLGAFLIGQILWQWAHPEKARTPEDSLFRGLWMGALSGGMLGTVGMPSHVMAAYLTGMNLSKTRYLFVMSIIQITLRVATITSLFVAGAYTGEAVVLMLIVSVPVFAGFFVGTRLFKRLPEQTFFRTVKAILFVMALSLVIANREILYTFL